MAVAIPIIVILVARRRARSSCSRRTVSARTTGLLSRETREPRRGHRRRGRRRARRRRPSSRPPAASAPTRRAPRYERRAREARGAATSSSGSRSTRRSSASPAGSSSTGASAHLVGFSLAGFGAACLGFLWPTGSSGFGGKITAGKVSDIVAYVDVARRAVLRPRSARLRRSSTRPQDLAGREEGVQPGHLRRHGAGVRRAVPALRAPRLSRAVVPDLAVVRVPVPRLEVQPGRREEGRPGAPRPRPLRDHRRAAGRSPSTPATSSSGRRSAPTRPDSNRKARFASDQHSSSRARGDGCRVECVVTVRHVLIGLNLVAVLAIVGYRDLGGAVAEARVRGDVAREPHAVPRPTKTSRAGGSSACRVGRCCSPRSSRSRCRSTGCTSRPARRSR